MPTDSLILPEVVFGLSAQGAPTKWSVVRAHLTEGLSEPYECALELATREDLDPLALLGEKVALTMARESAVRRLAGVVVSVVDRGYAAGHRLVDAVVAPHLWLLGKRSNYRVFQELDAVAVVEAVLQDAGLYQGEALRKHVDAGDLHKREYCTQYGETDLAFVRRLLEEEGLAFGFEHEGDSETLVLTDGSIADVFPPLETGGPVQIVGSGGATDERETVRTLERNAVVASNGVRLRDYDFTRPRAIIDQASRGGPDALGPRVRLEYPGPVTLGPYNSGAHTYGESDVRRAVAVRAAADTAEEVYRGRSNVAGLLPGRTVELMREDSDAPLKLLVTRVVHLGEAPERLTLSESNGRHNEDRYQNHFEAVPTTGVFRPERVTPKPRASSPQSAVVVPEPKTSADVIATDHYGRIKVRFQWDRPDERPGRESQKNASCWMRVSQAWAGAGWGFVFLPRVGMEVLVQFLDGDPDRPVVTGCLYNAVNGVPEALPDHKTRSILRTQSTPGAGYNELSFEDSSGHENVFLRAQKDLTEKVLNDHKAEYDHDETVTVGNDQTLHVKHDRKATVDNDDALDVLKNRKATVGENDTLEVTRNRAVTIFGASTLTVSQTRTVSIDEGLTITVGGNSGTQLKMLPDSITLKFGAATITLDAKGVRTVMQGQSVDVGASAVKVAGIQVTAATSAGAKVDLMGPTATLESSAVTTIKGTLVKIN